MESAPASLRVEQVLRLKGHERSVSSAKFSPDGRFLATSSADKTVMIWNVQDSFALVRTLKGHTRGVSDVAWSPDGGLLASASDDNTILVWSLKEAEPEKPKYTLSGHKNYVFCVAFHPTGNILASGSFDESVRLWDMASGACLRTIPAHSDPVTSVAFSPDGTILVTSSYDGLMRLWDTASGRCLKTLVDNDNPPVSSAVFAPNGKYILAGTLDSTIRLWSHQAGRCVKSYTSHQNVRYCCFPAFVEGGLIASGSEDGKLYVWDMNSKTALCSQQLHTDGPLVALGVSPNGSLVASATLEPDTSALPVYFVTGPAASGKTKFVLDALKHRDSCLIDCQFYDSVPPIINQLGQHLGIRKAISSLRELVEELTPVRIDLPKYIILDHAEALHWIDPKALRLLCSLRQLSGGKKISVILVSRKSWAEFGQLTAACSPIFLQAPVIPHDQLGEDLLASVPHGSDLASYILSSTKSQRHDRAYMESLVKRLAKHFLQYGHSESTFQRMYRSSQTTVKELLDANNVSLPSKHIISSLSLVEKYLLLAIHLASKIHPRNDCRVFAISNYAKRNMVHKVQQNGTKKDAAAALMKTEKRKTVPLERLFAIFYHIYPTGLTVPSRTLASVALARLAELKLVLRMNPASKLDAFKIRSNVPSSFVGLLEADTTFKTSGYFNGL